MAAWTIAHVTGRSSHAAWMIVSSCLDDRLMAAWTIAPASALATTAIAATAIAAAALAAPLPPPSMLLVTQLRAWVAAVGRRSKHASMQHLRLGVGVGVGVGLGLGLEQPKNNRQLKHGRQR